MAAQVKRFGDHSKRWQREARKKGIDPKKWDRWRQLTPKSRKVTNPADYGSGETVRHQIRKALLDAAVSRVADAHNTQRGARRQDGSLVRAAAVRRNLDHPDAGLTNAGLRRLTRMSPQQLAREIDDSLGRRYGAGERSPFWYEKRG
jgi:hypothetical protein